MSQFYGLCIVLPLNSLTCYQVLKVDKGDRPDVHNVVYWISSYSDSGMENRLASEVGEFKNIRLSTVMFGIGMTPSVSNYTQDISVL